MSLEFISTSDPEWKRIAALIDKEFPEACIISIDRIINDDNIRRFSKRTSDCPDVNIQEMFHGTKAKNVDSIIEHGLQARFNQRSAWGRGTYFSDKLTHSLFGFSDQKNDDAQFIFICDVLTCDRHGESPVFVCARDDSFCLRYLVMFNKTTKK